MFNGVPESASALYEQRLLTVMVCEALLGTLIKPPCGGGWFTVVVAVDVQNNLYVADASGVHKLSCACIWA